MPSERRRCEVCDAEDVETATEDDAGDTIESRGVPGDLRSVDGKMRGDGALQALLRKEFLASLLADLSGSLGVCESVAELASWILGARVDGVSSW